jgi:hypothetical protein
MQPAEQSAFVTTLLTQAKSSAHTQARFFLANLDEQLSLQALPDQFTGKKRPSYLPIGIDIGNDELAGEPADVKRRYKNLQSALTHLGATPADIKRAKPRERRKT